MKSIALPYVILCIIIFSTQETKPSIYSHPLTEKTTISMEPRLLYPPQKSNNDLEESKPLSYPTPLKENSTISMEPRLLYPPQKSNNDLEESKPLSYPTPLKENSTFSMEPRLLYPPQKSNNDETLNSKENNLKKIKSIFYKHFKKNEKRHISVSHLKERYPLYPDSRKSEEEKMHTILMNDIKNALEKLNKQYRFDRKKIQETIISKQIKNGLMPHNINFLASQIIDELEEKENNKDYHLSQTRSQPDNSDQTSLTRSTSVTDNLCFMGEEGEESKDYILPQSIAEDDDEDSYLSQTQSRSDNSHQTSLTRSTSVTDNLCFMGEEGEESKDYILSQSIAEEDDDDSYLSQTQSRSDNSYYISSIRSTSVTDNLCFMGGMCYFTHEEIVENIE